MEGRIFLEEFEIGTVDENLFGIFNFGNCGNCLAIFVWDITQKLNELFQVRVILNWSFSFDLFLDMAFCF